MVLESGELRRLTPELTLQYHFAALIKRSETKAIPLPIKLLASKLLKRMQDYKSLCAGKREIIKKERAKQANYNRTIKKEQALQAELGEVLDSCKDTHTISSLRTKIATSMERIRTATKALEELEAKKETMFLTIDEILFFLE